MVFWGIEVKPGEPQAYDPKNEERKLHLTQATLGAGSGKEKSVIQCSVGGNSPVYLCSLLPNKSECCPLKLEFDYNDEAVEFSVTGDRSIHLSGFLEAYDEEECEDQYDEEEDDSDGIDIGDDSESGESEYDSEEDEDDLEDFIDHNLDMYRQSSVPNSGVVIEEIEDDETPVKDDKTKRSKKKKSQASKDENANKQIIVKESAHAPVLESEDEDGLPISKEKTLEVEKKSAAKVDLGDDEQGSNKKRKAKAPEQKSVNKNKKKKNQKEKKNEEADEKVETEDVLKKEETCQSSLNPNAQTGAVNNAMGESSETQVQSAEKKKKKKKKKSNEEAKEESKAISSRTYPNGLVVEEIKMGKPDGKKATPGKQVSVSYTGKLQENGKVFDSNKSGFKFRLGVGQVIKGWDVGVNGMRVGDKRKLTIPPSMGYGAHGAGGDIPPNAWLSFDVELLDVK
ncbi:peptidyl-prolyl cis-trans isomerase FKBP53 [Raphanus sativus]|uniref:FK506-binding protein n=1 Tax=Raphanus sativus TaxID=3726 RepID=A0A6J0MZV3_RAPSA|nr:peptidyl-prolyl cis-trans isomerase FKBP53 [Raphanus sativus]